MSEALRSLVAAWWSYLAPSLVQGTLALLMAALVDGLLPRRVGPAPRACAWWLALSILALPPGLLGALAPLGVLIAPLGPGEGALGWAVPSASDPAPPLLAALIGWFAVALSVLSLGLVGHFRALGRAARGARVGLPAGSAKLAAEAAERVGLDAPPQVLWGPRVRAPFVAGFLRARVYLPERFVRGLDPEELRHVLYHELVHLKRRDPARRLATLLLAAAAWFHPLVWRARRRLAELEEESCDRQVVCLLEGDAASYRRTLLRLALREPGRGEAIAEPALVGRRRAPLLERLDLLTRPRNETPRARRAALTAVSALLLATLVPIVPASASAIESVSALIERPPGCMLLRMEVYRRLAEERAAVAERAPEASGEGKGERP